MIVLIGGEKGGPGKTTIAINLSVMRILNNKEVLLVDTDKQSTASYWCSVREDKELKPRISSVQKFGKAVRTEVKELNEKYNDIIIDAGGRDSPELRGGLLVADIVVFPIRPSQFDLWTMGRLNTLVETAKEYNEKLKAYVCFNQVSTNPSVAEIQEAKEFAKDFSCINMMKKYICQRIVFRRASIQGKGVVEYSPEDAKAKKEIESIYEEIYG